MTLQNHLFTNTIPLPLHHHILILNSQKNVSQNRTHFPQNLSHAAWSTHIVVLHTQQEVWIMLSKVIRAPVYFL